MAKQVSGVFDKVYQKHKGKISVSAQSCTLLDDHLLPMIQIVDKQTSEIVGQVFNFVDTIGG